MKTSYNWIKEYIKGDVPGPEKVSELLTDHSFEVEEIKKKGNDWILNIDVLPNRACDCDRYYRYSVCNRNSHLQGSAGRCRTH